jgi:hypothetical protein
MVAYVVPLQTVTTFASATHMCSIGVHDSIDVDTGWPRTG